MKYIYMKNEKTSCIKKIYCCSLVPYPLISCSSIADASHV